MLKYSVITLQQCQCSISNWDFSMQSQMRTMTKTSFWWSFHLKVKWAVTIAFDATEMTLFVRWIAQLLTLKSLGIKYSLKKDTLQLFIWSFYGDSWYMKYKALLWQGSVLLRSHLKAELILKSAFLTVLHQNFKLWWCVLKSDTNF